jgi:hypothetical protein
MKRKRLKRHWYRLYIGECPVCGHDKSYRERVYGKKPNDNRKRYVYLSDKETYDHCMG